ncbi:MAG: hypothetical protein ACPGSD_09680 [Flavobacteriales bacterium]
MKKYIITIIGLFTLLHAHGQNITEKEILRSSNYIYYYSFYDSIEVGENKTSQYLIGKIKEEYDDFNVEAVDSSFFNKIIFFQKPLPNEYKVIAFMSKEVILEERSLQKKDSENSDTTSNSIENRNEIEFTTELNDLSLDSNILLTKLDTTGNLINNSNSIKDTTTRVFETSSEEIIQPEETNSNSGSVDSVIKDLTSQSIIQETQRENLENVNKYDVADEAEVNHHVKNPEDFNDTELAIVNINSIDELILKLKTLNKQGKLRYVLNTKTKKSSQYSKYYNKVFVNIKTEQVEGYFDKNTTTNRIEGNPNLDYYTTKYMEIWIELF